MVRVGVFYSPRFIDTRGSLPAEASVASAANIRLFSLCMYMYPYIE